MKKNLLILGAGQYGQFVREIAEATDCFDRIAFLDDRNPCAVSTLAEYGNYKGDYPCAFVAIGNSELRMLLLNRLKEVGYSLVTLIHPTAAIAPSAVIGCGSVIEPMAVVQSNATIGEGTIIASGAVIKHNAVVGNGCYVDCNSTVLAGAIVPNGEKVFANTVVEGRK